MKVLAKDLEVGMKATCTFSGVTTHIGKIESDHCGRVVIYDQSGKKISANGKRIPFIVNK